ncbi:MAG: chromosome segregation protein SMC [Blastopirellula sp.]|nr:MAG: chromosome segregation protein SMC [Blastopirellula sp.]
MLKALELQGFKSFADKTRFEFPPGITVVVGPNGSGKSNIVDAIKWVLGEQSAKSMRGKEMADVIFKGAGAQSVPGARKALNSAEATIVFDNSNGLLPLDAPEVHLTRRVYRSGEGEYLINRHPCRLRDIRDLCSGTGVGADSYSIIEQGKVDTMLQASPRDRRAIFEEAAGISRFKSKKLETQRRLLRIDQNLIRLADIVDEVESRLKSVRAQAGKARRYREYSSRLQELRTYVGLVDWRALTSRLEEYEVELSQLREESIAELQIVEKGETQSALLEVELREIVDRLGGIEAEFSRATQRVATLESATQLQYRQLHDQSAEIENRRNNIQRTSGSLRLLHDDVVQTEELLETAKSHHQTINDELSSVEEVSSELSSSVLELREAREQRRKEHVDLLKTTSTLDNSIGSIQATIEACQQRIAITEEELETIRENSRIQDAEFAVLEKDEQQYTTQVQQQKNQLDQAQTDLSQHRQDLHQLQKSLTDKQHRRAAAHERSVVLEELERRYEGLNAGVKEVLARSQDEKEHIFRSVVGLVADIFQVDVEIAELIEIALAESAHYVVLENHHLLDAVLQKRVRFPGRVGFIDISSIPANPTNSINSTDNAFIASVLEGEEAILGTAAKYVQCESQFRPLANHLLGNTWLVESFADALDLRKRFPENYRLVTKDGELIEPDGRIVVGPRSNAAGIISRRSELRALRDELSELDEVISVEASEVAQMQAAISDTDHHLREIVDQHRNTSDILTDHRARKRSVELRVSDLKLSLESRAKQRTSIKQENKTSEEQLTEVRLQLEEARLQVIELEQSNTTDSEKIQQLESERSQILQQATSLKVDLAKGEQQVESLKRQLIQSSSRLEEKETALAEDHIKLAGDVNRLDTLEREILSANSELAELYLVRENQNREVIEARSRRQTIDLQKSELQSEANLARQNLRGIEEKIHRKELSAGDIRHERGTMATRLREDYGIELAELEEEPDPEEAEQRTAIDEEIADLRRKVSNIGAVNTDALKELDELEKRYESLAGQLKDLTDAKESLEKIIHKIDADSRRLFEETLTVVKSNFQALFRKVFGGGSADIILEEGVDILESGIDIIANPPGKSPLNISLLSGGERALTAVTLLLAIFQFRPSPFCVLDEVDGPLDEANIGRFIDVLKEFLDWTQFIIVTHSKTTMSAANTLYGVTMQESGISKRVSVKFDDVSEDGHISKEAIRREDQSKKPNQSSDVA